MIPPDRGIWCWDTQARNLCKHWRSKRLLKDVKTGKLEFCKHCIISKNMKVKFSTVMHCAKGILDYVHMDIWGPTKNTSPGGNHYFVSSIDDYSSRSWVYTMWHKNEVLYLFVKWRRLWRSTLVERSRHSDLIMVGSTRMICFYSYDRTKT